MWQALVEAEAALAAATAAAAAASAAAGGGRLATTAEAAADDEAASARRGKETALPVVGSTSSSPTSFVSADEFDDDTAAPQPVPLPQETQQPSTLKLVDDWEQRIARSYQQ